MLSYGLKPYNEEDCEEALEISRSLKGINDEMDFILVISIIINNIMSRGISPWREVCWRLRLKEELIVARKSDWNIPE